METTLDEYGLLHAIYREAPLRVPAATAAWVIEPLSAAAGRVGGAPSIQPSPTAQIAGDI
jgi:hypothetical protein